MKPMVGYYRYRSKHPKYRVAHETWWIKLFFHDKKVHFIKIVWVTTLFRLYLAFVILLNIYFRLKWFGLNFKMIVNLIFSEFFQSEKVLLGMWSNLRTTSCANKFLDLFPVFSINLKAYENSTNSIPSKNFWCSSSVHLPASELSVEFIWISKLESIENCYNYFSYRGTFI